jgi:hypothetical protein
MREVKLTRKWAPLVIVGQLPGTKPYRSAVVYYRRRRPGEKAPFAFAVQREDWAPWKTERIGPAVEANKSYLRYAYNRLVAAGLNGTIARELKRRIEAD